MGFVGRKDSDSLTNDLLFAKKNDRWLQVAPLIRPSSPCRAARLPCLAPPRLPRRAPPRRRVVSANARPSIEIPKPLGNTIPKGWEHDSQRPGILFSVCRKILYALVHRVPAAGTSSASRWYFNCQPLVLQLPAAGNSIASRGQFNCRPRAMRLPALGNAIAKPGGNPFAGSRGHFTVMSVRPATPVCGGCPLRD